MAPCLLVTKSSPPSGGGSEKTQPAGCHKNVLKPHQTGRQGPNCFAKLSTNPPSLVFLPTRTQTSGSLWTVTTTSMDTLACAPDKAYLLSTFCFGFSICLLAFYFRPLGDCAKKWGCRHPLPGMLLLLLLLKTLAPPKLRSRC